VPTVLVYVTTSCERDIERPNQFLLLLSNIQMLSGLESFLCHPPSPDLSFPFDIRDDQGPPARRFLDFRLHGVHTHVENPVCFFDSK